MFKLCSLTLLILTFTLCTKKHPLSVLLTLEIFCLLIIIFTLLMSLELFYSLMMVCIGACEGAVGLGALISNTRHSNTLHTW